MSLKSKKLFMLYLPLTLASLLQIAACYTPAIRHLSPDLTRETMYIAGLAGVFYAVVGFVTQNGVALWTALFDAIAWLFLGPTMFISPDTMSSALTDSEWAFAITVGVMVSVLFAFLSVGAFVCGNEYFEKSAR